MRVVHKRCAGLDVHQKSITACVRVALKRKVNPRTPIGLTCPRKRGHFNHELPPTRL